MHTDVARDPAHAPLLTDEQYFELRAEVEAELRRIAPAAEGTALDGLDGLNPRTRQRALQLVDVLRRMETDAYGVCVGCRRPIAYERLSAIPETTVCAQCSWTRELSLRG